MKFGYMIKIILGVLSDWRVIVAVVGAIAVMEIAVKVTSYTKKAPRVREKKGKKGAEKAPDANAAPDIPPPAMSESEAE